MPRMLAGQISGFATNSQDRQVVCAIRSAWMSSSGVRRRLDLFPALGRFRVKQMKGYAQRELRWIVAGVRRTPCKELGLYVGVD